MPQVWTPKTSVSPTEGLGVQVSLEGQAEVGGARWTVSRDLGARSSSRAPG